MSPTWVATFLPSTWRSNLPVSRRRDERLLDGDRAGLALVGEGAVDLLADADLDGDRAVGDVRGRRAVLRLVVGGGDRADEALELVLVVRRLRDVVRGGVVGAGVRVDRGARVGLAALEVEAAGRLDRRRRVEVERVGGIAAVVDLRDLDRAVGRERARGARGPRQADAGEERGEPDTGSSASRPGVSRAESPQHRCNPQTFFRREQPCSRRPCHRATPLLRGFRTAFDSVRHPDGAIDSPSNVAPSTAWLQG